jgi:hypothetical protein
MTAAWITAGVLGVAVLLASVRLVLWYRSAAAPSFKRLIALLLLQPICAALLFLTLFPPAVKMGDDVLRIATKGTPRLAAAGGPVIQLPEAPDISTGERVPDLATALRRHTGISEIVVLGDSLPPRDMETAKNVAVRFDPPPLRAGISHIAPPAIVAPGSSFSVGGQLSSLPRATVELLDPAGQMTDSVQADADGRFMLTGTARAAGAVLFTLRVRDGRRTVEQASVPVLVADSPAPRLLILSAAPNAEIKYLRRWATDAGFAVTTQMSAGGGIALGDAPIAIDSATLRRFDVAIIDDRSSATKRGVVMGAVRDGLGLILRASGPIDATTRGQWRALGFGLTGKDGVAPLALPKPPSPAVARTRQGIGNDDVPADIALPDEMLPEISRLGLTPDGGHAVPLLRDAGGTTLAAWRAVGMGRVALFTGIDSYALTLTGHRTLYGDWWSAMLATVARPAPGMTPITTSGWAGERMILCGLTAAAQIERPDGRTAKLLPVNGCGAFWPDKAGWHLLRKPGDNPLTPFYVQPANALPVMRAARDRDAMLMVRPPASGDRTATLRKVPGSSWPFALAWLLVSALLWWMERAQIGRAALPQSAK